MVTSTYALRDSCKVNSQYNNATQTKDDDNNTTEKSNRTRSINIHTDTYPKKKKQSALYSSSDFYTTNDPQYYQYGKSTATKTKKRKMTKNRNAGMKKKINSGRKKKKAGTSSAAAAAAAPSIPPISGVGASSGSTTVRIRSPGKNDVLCGRGGNVNNHPGNIHFRNIVNVEKRNYTLNANKHQKTEICNTIIDRIHNQEPKGKFLTKETGTNFWVEVDHAKAVSKTSQALREGAPKLRAEANSVTSADDDGATSRNRSKRGRKATTGTRKRAKYESRTNSKSEDDRGKCEEREPEVDAALHPRIAPMSNGHRGKQLIPRSDPDEGVEDEGVSGSTGGAMTTPSKSEANLDVENSETKEERAMRIKNLKEIMKPRSQYAPMTPASPQQPPSLQDFVLPPQASAATTEISQVTKNTIPMFPKPSVVKKPSSSFFRAHSLATSDEINGSSDILRVDDEFVNPFDNEVHNESSVQVGASSCADTNAPAGGIDKNGSVFTSPTTVSATPINSSPTSTEIANSGISHSPLTNKSNCSTSARDERSYSAAYKSEPNVYRTNLLGGTAKSPDTGRKSNNYGLFLLPSGSSSPFLDDEDPSSFDVLYFNHIDPSVGEVDDFMP